MNAFLQWCQTVLRNTVIPVIVLWIAGLLFVRLILRFTERALKRTHLNPTAHTLLYSILQVILYLLFGCAVAASLGVDITGIVALASVLTLAISLSLQNALSNVFGGCSLLYTKPFTVDDFVEIDGQTGTVQEIGLTYTRLITPDGKIIFLPNHQVASVKIINYTTSGLRRVGITVTLPFSIPAETVFRCLLAAAHHPQVQPSPTPFANIGEYRPYGVVYNLYAWCRAEDYWTVLFSINKKCKELLEQENISIPVFPQYPE